MNHLSLNVIALMLTVSGCGYQPVPINKVSAEAASLETGAQRMTSRQTDSNELNALTERELLTIPGVSKLMQLKYEQGYIEGNDAQKVEMSLKLKKMDHFLTQIFNFQRYYIKGQIQPPKIGEIQQQVQVMNDGKTRIVQEQHLEILEPAKFVSNPKDWQSFLNDNALYSKDK